MRGSAAALGTFVTALALASASAAQPRYPIALESKFGACVSTFRENNPGAKNRTGLASALAVHVGLNGWLSVQTELTYAMKGASYGTVIDPSDGFTTYYGTYQKLYSTDYVELPVLLRARVGGAAVRPLLMAGPAIALKVTEALQFKDGMGGEVKSTGYAFRAFDVCAMGGLGLEVGPKDNCLTIEGRYAQGLLSVLKPEYTGYVKNSDFRVTLGWKMAWAPVFGTL
jgi:hypothetical protein